MFWALALVSCRPAPVAVPYGEAELAAGVVELDFGSVGYDDRAELSLEVKNLGTVAADAAVSVEGDGFVADRQSLQIPGLGTASLSLWFTPGVAEGLLRVDALEIALLATIVADADGDGAAHVRAGGDDCDDLDAEVHPGADEVWYDGVDQDCAGDDDQDADGDGAPLDEDCDDSDSSVYPGALEVFHDEVDQDCDGLIEWDADGDGFDAEPAGADCDDEDPAVHPGASELWYDGVDQDCAGNDDFDQDGDGEALQPWGADCDDESSGTGPGQTEVDDGIDQDCDGIADEDFLAANQLLISEVHAKATAKGGDFLEIWNRGSRTVVLDGWTLGGVTLSGTLAPDARGVVCESGSDNGGLSCLASGLGDIGVSGSASLVAGSLTVDSLSWSTSWGITNATSIALKPGATSNDSAARWCVSTETDSVTGDLASPGAVDGSCG